MAFDVDVARIVWGFAVLGLAAWTDLRTRRVPNEIWIEGTFVAALLLVWDAYVYGSLGWLEAATALAFGLFAYGVWRLGLIGGADAKAFIWLSVLLPTPLSIHEWGLGLPAWAGVLPTVLLVYVYTLVAFLLVPLSMLLQNLLAGDLRFPHALLGYPMPLSEVPHRKVWLLERPVTGGGTRLRSSARMWDPEDHRAALETFRATGLQRVWVTPRVPFVALVLAGFTLAVFVGEPPLGLGAS